MTIKKLFNFSFLLLVGLLPFQNILAQDVRDVFSDSIMPVLKMIPSILIGVAFIVFAWGIIKYVLADGEKAKKEGGRIMSFGVIAMTVIVGVWGIVFFLQKNFQIVNPISPGSSKPILQDIIE